MTRNESQRGSFAILSSQCKSKETKNRGRELQREIEAAKILINESQDTNNEKQGM